MKKVKTTRGKPSAPPILTQKQIDQIARANQIDRLCPICEDLKGWFTEERRRRGRRLSLRIQNIDL